MKRKTSALSVISLVLGIIGLLIFGIVLGILALIFGGLGLSRDNYRYKGHGIATAGLILGVIDVFIMIILIVFFPDYIIGF